MDDHSSSDANPPGPSGGHSSQANQTQCTVTHINFINVGQVIHVAGENNVVEIPHAKVAMYQQAVGMNPTIGMAVPRSSVPPQTDSPHPSQFHPSATDLDHGGSYSTTRMGVFEGHGGTVTSSRTTQPNPAYAEGPPEGIELVELTQKLMSVLGDNWTMLSSYLGIPDHELVATQVEERTLYRKINRLLKFWVNLSADNDRKQLASVLSQVGPYNLGRCANEVFQPTQSK